MTLKRLARSLVPASLRRSRDVAVATVKAVQEIRDLMLSHQTAELQRAHPNPLNEVGKKCFSQSDEDGLTLEILRRIGCLESGVFAEFGVGDGMENNTLILKALGWRGFWVGGEELAFKISQPADVFSYLKEWITLENIDRVISMGQERLGVSEVDVISLDLDGNDIHFAKKILTSGIAPKLFVVEYNGKFPPPVKWQIRYDAAHTWNGDDYFGASLTSFSELFERHTYRLICCNSATGANAFFIRGDLVHHFADVPTSLSSLYVSPRYFLSGKLGHRPAIRTVAALFA